MFSKLIILSTLAIGVLAGERKSTSTLSGLFFPTPTLSLAASVVDAGNFQTTLAVVCTAGDGCDSGDTITITYGSTLYEISTSEVNDGTTTTFSSSCSIGGTSTAICVASTLSHSNGQDTTTSSTTNFLSGTAVAFDQIVVTDGAQKLSDATKTNKNAAPAQTAGLSGIIIGGAALVAGALL